MAHPLDPGAPLKHANDKDFTEEERLVFFQNVELKVREYYKEKRLDHYQNFLTIADQLDMLWHELNETESISKNGAWFKSIESVKKMHPKDDSEYQRAVDQVKEIRKKRLEN